MGRVPNLPVTAVIPTLIQPILQQLVEQIQLLTQTVLANQQVRENPPPQLAALLQQIAKSQRLPPR